MEYDIYVLVDLGIAHRCEIVWRGKRCEASLHCTMTRFLAHKETFFCLRPLGKARNAAFFHTQDEINDAYRIVMKGKKLFACKDSQMKRPWLVGTTDKVASDRSVCLCSFLQTVVEHLLRGCSHKN